MDNQTLIDVVKKEYESKKLPGNLSVDQVEDKVQVLLQDGNNGVFYMLKHHNVQDYNSLHVEEITISPKFDRKVFLQTLDINYEIAKKLACNRIAGSTLKEEGKNQLENKGYSYSHGRYSKRIE